MTPPYCLPQKRNKNGNHLQLRPKINLLTGNDSSPLKRLRLSPSQRLSPNTSNAKGKVVSVEGPPSLTHTPNASIKLLRTRVHLPRLISWPAGRKPLLTLSLKWLTSPTEKPQAPHVKHSDIHRDHLRSSHGRIQVKSIAGHVVRRVITLVIALATPRESPFWLKTSHFDRSWPSKHSHLPRRKLRFESWTHTIIPSVTIA
jgi:hypothetical protein